MKIHTRGNNDKMTRREVRYATKWMSALIMSNQLMPNITVHVVFQTEEGLKGSTECIDSDVKPREFQITIDPNLSRKSQLRTLAHELVHVKQFSCGEMRYTKYTELIKWYKQTLHCEETEYWDLPWEIEAFGREHGMYVRYIDHLAKEKIRFGP